MARGHEYSLKGVKEAATEKGLDFSYIVSQSTDDFEKSIETQIAEGANLVVTVGIFLGDATKAAAISPSSWFLSKKRVVFAVSKNVYLNILAC